MQCHHDPQCRHEPPEGVTAAEAEVDRRLTGLAETGHDAR